MKKKFEDSKVNSRNQTVKSNQPKQKQTFVPQNEQKKDLQEPPLIIVKDIGQPPLIYQNENPSEICSTESLITSAYERPPVPIFETKKAFDNSRQLDLLDQSTLKVQQFLSDSASTSQSSIKPKLSEPEGNAIQGYLIDKQFIQTTKCDWLTSEQVSCFTRMFEELYRPERIYLEGYASAQYIVPQYAFGGDYKTLIDNFLKQWWQGFNYYHPKKQVLEAIDKIFFPVNINNSHWIFVLVDLVCKEVQVGDSLSNNQKPCLEEGFSYFLGKLNLGTFKYVYQSPKQTNGMDCGVFVIKAYQTVAQGLLVTTVSYDQKKITKFRQTLVEVLKAYFCPNRDEIILNLLKF